MIVLLRSTAFAVALLIVTPPYALLALATAPLPRMARYYIISGWSRCVIFLSKIILRIDWRVEGRENLPPGPAVILAKHQSAWETLAFQHIFPPQVHVLKRELLWIPFFGWFARHAGMIPVDRGGRKAALVAMTARARAALGQGRQIVVFPEGTRRPTGAEPSYKIGIAHLYSKGTAPCVPIALNSGLFWPRRKFMRYPGTITVEVLDPIGPGLPMDEFFTRLQHEIESATARLVAQAGARA
jgi:1-acyl-sn-glycerol-3-phosphate acyltransferase